MSRIRRHLTFANIVSVIALFLALGGIGAYAASRIGAGDIKRNAVRTRHIKAGEVKRSDLAKAAVSSSKLDLVRFDQRSSEVDITGGGSQPLGPRVTLDVPAQGTVVFEAAANIAKSANTVDCRLEATNAQFWAVPLRACRRGRKPSRALPVRARSVPPRGVGQKDLSAPRGAQRSDNGDLQLRPHQVLRLRARLSAPMCRSSPCQGRFK